MNLIVDLKAICLLVRMNISSAGTHSGSDLSDWTKDSHKLSNSTIYTELDRSNLYQFDEATQTEPIRLIILLFFLHTCMRMIDSKPRKLNCLVTFFSQSPFFFVWLLVVSKKNHFALFEAVLINKRSETYVICFRFVVNSFTERTMPTFGNNKSDILYTI